MGPRHVHTWYAPSRRVLMAWCNLALILWVYAGQAAMREISIADLARQADMIVVGTVTQQESAWDVQHTAIYTDVTLAVERVLAGTPGEGVTLRVAGGSVDGISMHTSNDPVFQDGERVLVFLDTSTVPSSVVGLQQGKFTVKDNIVTGTGETWSLDEFSAAVRTAAH